MNLNQIAARLDHAAHTAAAVEQISNQRPITLEEAYAIQSISLGHRYRRGERSTGLKMGFTSKAKMEQMGVHDMIWGRLTDHMARKDGGTLSMGDFIHPRAEPEIAFLVGKDIDRALSLEEAADYVEAVAVAVEIIDSRYENFKFSLEDVVADNCSSAAYAVGEWQPADTQITDIEMFLRIDGETVHRGNSQAILGNPWESVVNAARLAHENGLVLEKGSIILAGAATPAAYVSAGQRITATAEGLGSVQLVVQ